MAPEVIPGKGTGSIPRGGTGSLTRKGYRKSFPEVVPEGVPEVMTGSGTGSHDPKWYRTCRELGLPLKINRELGFGSYKLTGIWVWSVIIIN